MECQQCLVREKKEEESKSFTLSEGIASFSNSWKRCFSGVPEAVGSEKKRKGGTKEKKILDECEDGAGS